jgi:UDP-glucose-4-epimerase GalE
MSILVTGGAGYIGSHTVRLLREQGHDVVVLDTLEFGFREAVGDTPLVVGDIADEALVEQICTEHGVTACVHFAAYKNVGMSMSQPGVYWLNNVAGTVHLVDALLRHGVDRLVFSSSCSVYGTPATVPVDEAAPIHPESVYAETKAMMERILRWYDTTSGLRSASLRYFNAAGASSRGDLGEDWTNSLNLVPVTMAATLGLRPPVQVFGDDYPTPDGTAIRDYIHVDDLAVAHALALDYLADGGATLALNVGTGTGTSVKQIIEATAQISGQAVPHGYGPRREGDPVAVYADPTMGRDVLGWTPRYGLDEIISSAWAWHRDHPRGFST